MVTHFLCDSQSHCSVTVSPLLHYLPPQERPDYPSHVPLCAFRVSPALHRPLLWPYQITELTQGSAAVATSPADQHGDKEKEETLPPPLPPLPSTVSRQLHNGQSRRGETSRHPDSGASSVGASEPRRTETNRGWTAAELRLWPDLKVTGPCTEKRLACTE